MFCGMLNFLFQKRIRKSLLGNCSAEKCLSHCERIVHNYERDMRDLHIILFPEFIDHLSHVDRLIAWPGSSLLLVGKSGSGRRTVTHLVAHSHHLRLFTPTVGSWFDAKHLKAFFRSVVQCCVVENEGGCLFLEDFHVSAGTLGSLLLDYSTTLIQSQDIHSFYSDDELKALREELKDALQSEAQTGAKIKSSLHSLSSSSAALQSSFIDLSYRDPEDKLESLVASRLKRNLRIVISFDYTSSSFEQRLVQHPSIFTFVLTWCGLENGASVPCR